MAVPTPASRPKNNQAWFVEKLDTTLMKFGYPKWNREELVLFGCLGYYQLMGDPLFNDRRMYDDALCVLSRDSFLVVNANLDAGGFRPGHGHGSTKGMGNIGLGVHKNAYGIGHHKKIKTAVRQFGEIEVWRDADDQVPKEQVFEFEGRKYYRETGNHQAMNMHPGGINTVSSEGCQTTPPAQYPMFINLVAGESERLNQLRFTYVKDRIRG